MTLFQEVALLDSFDFSLEMLDTDACRAFWRGLFRPEGSCCPSCRTCVSDVQTEKWRDGGLIRCAACGLRYTWRTDTPLANRCLDERQLTLLCVMVKFQRPIAEIAAKVDVSTDTVTRWLKRLQGAA